MIHKAAISSRTFMLDFTRYAFDKFVGLRQCLMAIFDYLCSTMRFSNPQRRSSFELAALQVTTLGGIK
jgi:hypothetical protein